MCAVSAVIGTLGQFPPLQQWTLPPLYDLRTVLEKLDAIDKKLGAKDCHEPTKQGVIEALEARIAELEKRLP